MYCPNSASAAPSTAASPLKGKTSSLWKTRQNAATVDPWKAAATSHQLDACFYQHFISWCVCTQWGFSFSKATSCSDVQVGHRLLWWAHPSLPFHLSHRGHLWAPHWVMMCPCPALWYLTTRVTAKLEHLQPLELCQVLAFCPRGHDPTHLWAPSSQTPVMATVCQCCNRLLLFLLNICPLSEQFSLFIVHRTKATLFLSHHYFFFKLRSVFLSMNIVVLLLSTAIPTCCIFQHCTLIWHMGTSFQPFFVLFCRLLNSF